MQCRGFYPLRSFFGVFTQDRSPQMISLGLLLQVCKRTRCYISALMCLAVKVPAGTKKISTVSKKKSSEKQQNPNTGTNLGSQSSKNCPSAEKLPIVLPLTAARAEATGRVRTGPHPWHHHAILPQPAVIHGHVIHGPHWASHHEFIKLTSQQL